jgi:hypothetical protein
MAAGSTYTPIATTTLGSTASSYTFSSIPSTYTDLVLVTTAKTSSGSNDAIVRFNGDTGTNYSSTFLSGSGSAASSARTSNTTYAFLDSYGWVTSTDFNVCITQIMNYSNTTTYKTIMARSNNAAAGVDAIVSLYRSTSAISSITLFLASSLSFATGSTFTLYGIAAA